MNITRHEGVHSDSAVATARIHNHLFYTLLTEVHIFRRDVQKSEQKPSDFPPKIQLI